MFFVNFVHFDRHYAINSNICYHWLSLEGKTCASKDICVLCDISPLGDTKRPHPRGLDRFFHLRSRHYFNFNTLTLCDIKRDVVHRTYTD